jgi:hypothetical protein
MPSDDALSQMKLVQEKGVNIPVEVPEEIQVFIDAYVENLPLLGTASQAILESSWGLNIRKEFGYSFLGLFRIVSVVVSLDCVISGVDAHSFTRRIFVYHHAQTRLFIMDTLTVGYSGLSS